MNLLPTDLIKLLVNEYFHIREAFICMSLSKKFWQSLTKIQKNIILEKYLKYRNYKESEKYIKSMKDRHCKLCNRLLNNKFALNKHLEKHKKFAVPMNMPNKIAMGR